MRLISQYINYLAEERRYSSLTVKAYKQDIEEFCAFVGMKKEEFDPHLYDEEDVKMWIIDLLETKKYTVRSARRKISSLRGLFKYLMRMGKTNKNITKNIFLPKMPVQLPNYFREEEMQAVIAQENEIKGDYNEYVKCLIIEMFYQTGMRQAELLNLKETDVNTTEQFIKVLGKRRKERLIPFGNNLKEMIDTYRKKRDDVLRQSSINTWNSFWMRLGRKDEPVELTRFVLYEYVCDKMGSVSTLKKHSPHVLRHTCATAMLDGGADIRTIQKLLGHAGLSSTQIYTHTSFEKVKALYKKSHPRAQKNN